MKTVHFELFENNAHCFADDLSRDDDDCAVSFAFVDHDIDSFDYADNVEYTLN